MDKLAASALPNLDRQRVFMARTQRSLGALLGAPYRWVQEPALNTPSPLLAALRADGVHTAAFHTFHGFELPSLAQAFEENDDALVARMPACTRSRPARSRDARSVRSVAFAIVARSCGRTTSIRTRPTSQRTKARRRTCSCSIAWAHTKLAVYRTEAWAAHLVAAARASTFGRDAAIMSGPAITARASRRRCFIASPASRSSTCRCSSGSSMRLGNSCPSRSPADLVEADVACVVEGLPRRTCADRPVRDLPGGSRRPRRAAGRRRGRPQAHLSPAPQLR